MGYELEAAEGTFELLVREALRPGVHFFDLVSLEVNTKIAGTKQSSDHRHPSRSRRRTAYTPPRPAVTARFTRSISACANAFPACTRASLTSSSQTTKCAYSIPRKGTAAKVRVLVEWSDSSRSWATVGVSENVIEASWKALVDAIPPGTHAPDRQRPVD